MNIHFMFLAAGYSKRYGGNKLLSMYNGMPMYRVLLDKLVRIMESDPTVADITVVTQYPEIEREVEQINLGTAKPVRCIFNLDPSQGISSSIQCGINNMLMYNPDITFDNEAQFIEYELPFHQSADEIECTKDYKPEINTPAQSKQREKTNASADHLSEDFLCFFVADTPNLTEQTVTSFIHAFAASGKRLGCIGREGEMGNPGIFGAEFISELMELRGDRGGKRVLCAHRDEVFIFSDTKSEELEDIDFKC